MKNLFILLLSLAVAFPSMAQKMKQGSMKMTITDIKAPNMEKEQLDMLKTMMGGMITNIYFKGDKSITKMNVMGSEVTTIFDGKRTSVYTSMMGNKYVMHNEITDETTKEANEAMKNADIKKIDGKTEVIQGLKCQLYEMKSENENIPPMKFWTTKDIEVDAALLSQIPKEARNIGFPMKMEINEPTMGFQMVMEVSEITDKVDDSVFDFDTTGYKELTEEEMKQMGMR